MSEEEVVGPDEGVLVLEVDAVPGSEVLDRAVDDDTAVDDDDTAVDDDTVDDAVVDNCVVEVRVAVNVPGGVDESVTCNVVVSELFAGTPSRRVVAVATTL